VNKNIFNNRSTSRVAVADTVNEAGGKAYAFTPQHALAQMAATGCLNSTYYASGEAQLDQVLENARKCEPKFIAQTAIFARERGYMKDMPALLCAVLAARDAGLLEKVFPKVINNGKMLRNFVQAIRSGKVGRKSFGSGPKRMIQKWLDSRDDEQILDASVGNDPSLADVIKMVHPKPKNRQREAFYGYLLGKEYKADRLPEIVQDYEGYKAGKSKKVPAVPFQLLTSLDLGKKEWTEIAKNAKWHMTRMNINTFQRHGVFEDKAMIRMVADRLRDGEQIRKAKVFPYQLLMAYLATGNDIPKDVREALQDAMEIATDNVPEIDGQVYVFPDVSGSMGSAITGDRGSATTQVRCVDVAALIAAAIVRKNKCGEIIPFETSIKRVVINPRDSVMTNAQKLGSMCGGGTNCSAPLAELNSRKANADLLVYISDNESWVDNCSGCGTATMAEWETFKKRNPKAKMVCIDLQPYGSTQVQERKDILNVGGFSDHCFEIISDFAAGRLGAEHWVGEVKKIEL
jgi:60 kDa SS-A/Ro ribonucleoprotein